MQAQVSEERFSVSDVNSFEVTVPCDGHHETVGLLIETGESANHRQGLSNKRM
jgi:hypothetical protein